MTFGNGSLVPAVRPPHAAVHGSGQAPEVAPGAILDDGDNVNLWWAQPSLFPEAYRIGGFRGERARALVREVASARLADRAVQGPEDDGAGENACGGVAPCKERIPQAAKALQRIVVEGETPKRPRGNLRWLFFTLQDRLDTGRNLLRCGRSELGSCDGLGDGTAVNADGWQADGPCGEQGCAAPAERVKDPVARPGVPP